MQSATFRFSPSTLIQGLLLPPSFLPFPSLPPLGPVVGANQPQRNMGDGIMIGGNYITRITDDDREKEMEENIENVSNMVGNLRNMAIDAGQEIDNQNHLIDRINRKAEANAARVKDANERATNML